VRVCELGVPFSDPVADGPTIQNAYNYALERGVNSQQIFETVGRYRSAGGSLALVAMVSYSIVFRHRPEEYFRKAREAGFDGMVIPDLPLEEAGPAEALATRSGLANVLLIAPTTEAERRLAIARHSRGFIYYISVAGITGERSRLPEQTIAAVAELRKHTDTPVCVGFGISRPEMVRTVCEVADGAIVGSAIVHRIADAAGLPRKKLVAKIGEFIGDLMTPVR
jgi:tryptophan synthase alpha chain